MRAKFHYIRSKPLLEAFRAIACQHCGRTEGVAAAHSNWTCHGKGRSIKASDIYCASLCHRCHIQVLDQGMRLSRVERQAMWWAAHVRSVALMVARGLWPAKIALPDIVNCPFDLEAA